MPLSILVAVANRPELRYDLTEQLAADGHTVHRADHRDHTAALLAGGQIDVLMLGALEHRAAAPMLLRELRAGRLDPRVWPDVPTITLAPLTSGDRELDTLRAYAAGSDHHLPAGAGYLHQRAVLEIVTRRARGAGRRVLRIGVIQIDTAAHEVRVANTPVPLSGKEFALLVALASDPTRVFTKHELLRDVWGFREPGRTRTLDTHAAKLRRKLAEHGARAVINVWGVGYRLCDP